VFEARGVNTAIGIDEAGINDDRDMLQEMRLVLRAHRIPGIEEDEVPSVPQVVRMATEGGARTTAFADEIGRLEPGRFFDAVLVDWKEATYPYQDDGIPMLDALIQRAKASAVKAVYIDGERVYANGTFTKTDRAEVLREIAAYLGRPLSCDEASRRELSEAVFEPVRRHFKEYGSLRTGQPFYRPSSRI
jgi:cytosine/adenosine deaminase-related metal-dependent hydrolase